MVGVANQSSRERLDANEIAQRMEALTGWQVEGVELMKSYRFKDFVEAIDFVNAIAKIAESQNHHPDLTARWGEVKVRLTTHSAGGLTAKDFELASAIDQV